GALPKPLPAPPPVSALMPLVPARTRPGTGSIPPPPPGPLGTTMGGSKFPPPPPGLGKLPSVVPPGTLRPPSAPHVPLGTTRIMGQGLDRGSVTSVISTPEFRTKKRSRFVVGFIGALIAAAAALFALQ